MDVESKKRILQDEIKEQTTNVHKPFENKYASWKIIEYLWACHYANAISYEYKEWLLNLYKNSGMTNTESTIFSSQIDLIIETMTRNPKNQEYKL